MPTQHSADYKLAAIRYFQQHGNLAETCLQFHCNPRSLLNWAKRYQLENTVERKPRPQGAYKVSEAHVKSLLAQVIDLQTMLNDNHGVKLSLMHIQNE
jgi:transposase-like protein